MSGDGKRSVGHRPQATALILDSTRPKADSLVSTARRGDRYGSALVCGSGKQKVAGCQRAGETDKSDRIRCGEIRADDGIGPNLRYDEIVEVRDTRDLELYFVLALAEVVHKIAPKRTHEHEGILPAGGGLQQELRITPHLIGGVDAADKSVIAAVSGPGHLFGIAEKGIDNRAVAAVVVATGLGAVAAVSGPGDFAGVAEKLVANPAGAVVAAGQGVVAAVSGPGHFAGVAEKQVVQNAANGAVVVAAGQDIVAAVS